MYFQKYTNLTILLCVVNICFVMAMPSSDENNESNYVDGDLRAIDSISKILRIILYLPEIELQFLFTVEEDISTNPDLDSLRSNPEFPSLPDHIQFNADSKFSYTVTNTELYNLIIYAFL